MQCLFNKFIYHTGRTQIRVRFCSTIQMENNVFEPPEAVRGLMQLDKEKFRKTLTVPSIEIPKSVIGRIIGQKTVTDATIKKLSGIKPVSNGSSDDMKRILFDPTAVDEVTKSKILVAIEKVTGIKPEFSSTDVELTYDNWDIKRCLKAVLPKELEFSGYSQVGHIAHLNLREELWPFKQIIGQLLLDKVSWVKTVVNKTDSIATEFRNFDMELLAGEPNFIAEMRERGIVYRFDFRKVFWNSRLSTEHGRIVDKLTKNSVVFDIFAGVGPFALPAVKKGVLKVFANDKNPFSTKYMAENVQLNKISTDLIDIFTLDAVDFMKQVIASQIIGQLLLDKVSWVKTVVNKTDSIATEFRNFDMELLAGEPNFIAEMRERGIVYRFDFRKVFWNSRLSTEHGRIVDKLTKNSVVFDIFAGVGPFALPAVKKGVLKVFANDKNPFSTKYMAENVQLNKIPIDLIEIFTLDAVDFMKQVIALQVVEYIAKSGDPIIFHSIMNLPAIAIEFLPHFRGLLLGQE
uniref:tRNA (guanine(37)-N1)-methyltransferase n=2 Tax=Panagrolaimus sp. JU765 TaxID=591449 RepID=A0AC34RTF2_9BILA